jgi:hypothetical protein
MTHFRAEALRHLEDLGPDDAKVSARALGKVTAMRKAADAAHIEATMRLDDARDGR